MGTHDAAVKLIARLARGFDKALGDSDITLPQYRLLAFLDEGERAASALADWLEVSRPSITALVDGVVQRQWVARRESPDDRRRVLHVLTPTGRSRLAEATAVLSGVLDGLLDHLDPVEQGAALEGLSLLSTAATRRREEAMSS